MTEIKKDYDVRVFCPVCQNGNNMIWKGGLIDWGIMMSKNVKKSSEIPKWAQYAWRHQQAHGHIIMVEYPSRTVPMFDIFLLKEGQGK